MGAGRDKREARRRRRRQAPPATSSANREPPDDGPAAVEDPKPRRTAVRPPQRLGDAARVAASRVALRLVAAVVLFAALVGMLGALESVWEPSVSIGPVEPGGDGDVLGRIETTEGGTLSITIG